MNVSLGKLIDFSYFIIFFSGYQGGKYFANNRLQELAFASTFALFMFGAIKLAMMRSEIKWKWWFWSAPLLVAYPMLVAPVSFSINTNANVFFSFFATREFLMAFLAPSIYFMYKLGYPIERLEKVFVVSLFFLIINYLFHYFRLDLRETFLGGGYMSAQVTYDEWRGFRLKPPTYALFLITVYCLIFLVQENLVVKKVGVVLVLCMVGYVWYILLQRSQIAGLALSLLLYPLLFSRPKRINLLLFGIPIIFLAILMGSESFFDIFMEEDKIRAKSFNIAIKMFFEVPLFGFGQASNAGVTYQSLFGYRFFPSDLGLIGVFFRFGLIGGFIYLFFLFFILTRIVKANWSSRIIYKKHNPVILALLIWMISVAINIILIPTFGYIQGITTGALIIGLTACYRDYFEQDRSGNVRCL